MDNEEFSSFGIKNCEIKRYDFDRQEEHDCF
jgi:probable phosphoglycerate mutase